MSRRFEREIRTEVGDVNFSTKWPAVCERSLRCADAAIQSPGLDCASFFRKKKSSPPTPFAQTILVSVCRTYFRNNKMKNPVVKRHHTALRNDCREIPCCPLFNVLFWRTFWLRKKAIQKYKVGRKVTFSGLHSCNFARKYVLLWDRLEIGFLTQHNLWLHWDDVACNGMMAHEIILYQNYFSKNTQRPYFGRSDQMTKMSFRLRLTTMGRDISVVKGKNLKIGSCHVGFFFASGQHFVFSSY